MSNDYQTSSGYVCAPYLHDHDSIELKDSWVSSKNIESLYFVTATFSEDSKPYFLTSSNHYILAKFKNHEKISKEILSQDTDKPSFLFKIDDTIFERPLTEKTNFVSIYYHPPAYMLSKIKNRLPPQPPRPVRRAPLDNTNLLVCK